MVKIAIVGTGIAGLTAAYLLNRGHDITVFEARGRLGGHTATREVSVQGQRYAVDTGFIVFNDWTYPGFIKLMDRLGVASRPSEMGFSVSCATTGLEYSGSSLDTLFAQRRNLVSPMFLRMVWDIARFNRAVKRDLEAGSLRPDMTLGQYLQQGGYGSGFCRYYLIPMCAAIWSAGTDVVLGFPLLFFARFFNNHGLLNIDDRPQWRTIVGGSSAYLGPLTASFADRIRLNCPVQWVRREPGGVVVASERFGEERFDQVVLACHSDEALGLLRDPGEEERAALAAIPYQANEVVLHTDASLLPRERRTWSSWNYRLTADRQERAALTYHMNTLQGIDAPVEFCVTLNQTGAIDPSRILGRYSFSHPVFTPAGIEAQAAIRALNGRRHTWYCGAWCRNGFHEDGLASAALVAAALGEPL